MRRGFFRRAIRQFISRNALMSRNPAKGNSDGGVVDIIEIIFFFRYNILRFAPDLWQTRKRGERARAHMEESLLE